MPSIVASPDVAGAVTAHLLACPEIVALVSTAGGYAPGASEVDKAMPRIATQRRKSWNLPGYALLVEPGRGGFPVERPFEDERFDFRCYGPNDKAANDFWRLVNAYLIRHDGGPTMFIQANTSVDSVVREGGPLRLVDGDGLWPCTWASYHFGYVALSVGG